MRLNRYEYEKAFFVLQVLYYPKIVREMWPIHKIWIKIIRKSLTILKVYRQNCIVSYR